MLLLFLPPLFCSIVISCSSADKIQSSVRSRPMRYGPNKSLRTPEGTVYVPGAICGPAKFGCGLDGSPGTTE